VFFRRTTVIVFIRGNVGERSLKFSKHVVKKRSMDNAKQQKEKSDERKLERLHEERKRKLCVV